MWRCAYKKYMLPTLVRVRFLILRNQTPFFSESAACVAVAAVQACLSLRAFFLHLKRRKGSEGTHTCSEDVRFAPPHPLLTGGAHIRRTLLSRCPLNLIVLCS